VTEAVGGRLPPGDDEGRPAGVLAAVGEVVEDVPDGVVAREGVEAADDVPGVAGAPPVGDLLDEGEGDGLPVAGVDGGDGVGGGVAAGEAGPGVAGAPPVGDLRDEGEGDGLPVAGVDGGDEVGHGGV